MAKARSESELPLALAYLAAVFSEVLLQARPDIEHPLKMAVAKWANLARDAGPAHALASEALIALDRALHDPSLFPKRGT